VTQKGGFVVDNNTAPLWISEFGRIVNPQPGTSAEPWWSNIMAWLTGKDLDWCWWALNPTHGQSTIPFAVPAKALRANQGAAEPFGLLTQDWSAVGASDVMGKLKAIMPPGTGPGIAAAHHP
jgi:hypothetical protein